MQDLGVKRSLDVGAVNAVFLVFFYSRNFCVGFGRRLKRLHLMLTNQDLNENEKQMHPGSLTTISSLFIVFGQNKKASFL